MQSLWGLKAVLQGSRPPGGGLGFLASSSVWCLCSMCFVISPVEGSVLCSGSDTSAHNLLARAGQSRCEEWREDCNPLPVPGRVTNDSGRWHDSGRSRSHVGWAQTSSARNHCLSKAAWPGRPRLVRSVPFTPPVSCWGWCWEQLMYPVKL